MPGSLMVWRAVAARRSSPPGQEGFLLPMSMLVALVLMLSSLMLLTLALQSRLQAAVQRQRRHTEDALMSAAQVLAGRLQRQCPDLLVLPHSAWPGALEPGADGSSHPCGGIEAGEGYRLVAYAPGGGSQQENPDQGSGELVLELTGSDPAPRAAYALHWRRELAARAEGEEEGESAEAAEVAGLPRLMGLEERGLRESAAAATGHQEVER